VTTQHHIIADDAWPVTEDAAEPGPDPLVLIIPFPSTTVHRTNANFKCSIPICPLSIIILIVRIHSHNMCPSSTPPLLLQQLPQIQSRAIPNIARLRLLPPVPTTSRLVHVAVTSAISLVLELGEEGRRGGDAEAGPAAEFVGAGVADGEVDGAGGLVGVEGVEEVAGAELGDGVGLCADAFDCWRRRGGQLGERETSDKR